MTSSDKKLISRALAPNLAFVCAVGGLMAWRIVSGLSPLPHGAMSVVMALAVAVPLGSAIFANAMRLRRDA
jgi:hypothetical protein